MLQQMPNENYKPGIYSWHVIFLPRHTKAIEMNFSLATDQKFSYSTKLKIARKEVRNRAKKHEKNIMEICVFLFWGCLFFSVYYTPTPNLKENAKKWKIIPYPSNPLSESVTTTKWLSCQGDLL